MEQSRALARGMLRYDLIAWWATDALLEDGFDAERLRGWLVTPGAASEGDARMLGELPSGEIGVVASVRCDVAVGPTSCTVKAGFEPRALDEEESIMMRALATAGSDPFFQRRQARYNTIVLRGAEHGVDDSPWIVYIVAATTDAHEIPVGLHYRFDLSRDGSKVLRRRASHRGVMVLRLDAGPDGAEVEMLMTTAIYDREPSEFQIYVSGLWGVALGLAGCDGSLWSVRGMEVAQLDPPARKDGCVDPWREKPGFGQ